MAGEKDKHASPDGDAPVVAGEEGSSGEQIKKQPAPGVKALFAEFRTRSAGLTGADFDREVDRLIDQIVERNLQAMPVGLHDEMRDVIRSYLEHDPTLSSMVAELRAAARR